MMGAKTIARKLHAVGEPALARELVTAAGVAGKIVRVDEDFLADALRDITLEDPVTVRAWKKNQDLKHYRQTVKNHGEENVGICEACWRGVLRAKSVLITNGNEDFFI